MIVLDIEMPEMNGIEFLRERKKLALDIPVVVLSSIAREGARVTMECLELGASDFVTKPSGSDSADLHTVARQLVELLTGFGRQYQRDKKTGRAKKIPRDKLAAYGADYLPRRRAGNRTETISPETLATFQRERTTIVDRNAREIRKPVAVAEKPKPERSPGKIEYRHRYFYRGPSALRDIFSRIDPDLPSHCSGTAHAGRVHRESPTASTGYVPSR